MTQDAPRRRSRRRPGWAWAWMPVAVFGVQGVVLAVTIFLATGRGLDAVEPDYYAQSLDWDQRAALLGAADELGWSITPSFGAVSGARSEREVLVEIRDQSGEPVVGASVSVELFHHAYAGQRRTLELSPAREPGRYGATLPIRRAGLWELRVQTERGEDRCLTISSIELGG